ncbi:MAG: hypothetical protein Q9195_002284 [Heterodermia aff. obscurata]
MDFLQGADYLPLAHQLYNDYYTPYSAYLLPIQRTILLTQSYFYTYIFPYLWPAYRLFSKATSVILTDQPSFLTLVLLALVLFLSLKVLDVLRRTIIYWISIAVRLVIWGAIVGAGVYVYYRGVEESIEDAGYLLGVLSGWESEGKREGYRRASRRQREARNYGKRTPRGRTRGAGW